MQPVVRSLVGRLRDRMLDRLPPKCNSQLGYRITRPDLVETQFRPDTIGEAMVRAGPDIRRERRGNVDRNTPRGSVSAALGGGAGVLDRDLRDLVRLERAHVPVEAMMAEMRVVMTHPGVGIPHVWLQLFRLLGLDHRRLRRLALAGGKRR